MLKEKNGAKKLNSQIDLIVNFYAKKSDKEALKAAINNLLQKCEKK